MRKQFSVINYKYLFQFKLLSKTSILFMFKNKFNISSILQSIVTLKNYLFKTIIEGSQIYIRYADCLF